MQKRSDTSPPDIATPLPTDRPGLEDALTALLAERASLQDALAAHPDRERRLLARGAPEAEIASNDITKRRLLFQLDRIDEREQEIREALDAADNDQQLAAWSQFVGEFDRLSARFTEASRALCAAQEALADLQRRAAASGFNELEHPTARLPYPAFRIDYAGIEAFRSHLNSLRRVNARAAERRRLYLIRFNRYQIVLNGPNLLAYQKDAVAGFELSAAWRIVDGGNASWAEAVPPRPVGMKRAKRAEVTA